MTIEQALIRFLAGRGLDQARAGEIVAQFRDDMHATQQEPVPESVWQMDFEALPFRVQATFRNTILILANHYENLKSRPQG